MNQATPPLGKQEKLTFDLLVCEKLRRTFADILTAHPEVRSLVCSIDWSGPLNSSQIMHGVWQGETGVVATPDAIFGSIVQTLRMLETQFSRAMELNKFIQEQSASFIKEVADKSEELKRLNQAIEEQKEKIT